MFAELRGGGAGSPPLNTPMTRISKKYISHCSFMRHVAQFRAMQRISHSVHADKWTTILITALMTRVAFLCRNRITATAVLPY